VQKEIYLQRWAVTLGELLAVAASHQPARQLRHVLNSCLNLWVTLNDILWKFQYISTGWLSYELTRLTCLQCFDAVGWAARKGIRPVKNWWVAGVAICLERGADLHMARLMPLPLTVSCLSKIQNGFTFLVPADLGSPRQRAVKRGCVVCVWLAQLTQMS